MVWLDKTARTGFMHISYTQHIFINSGTHGVMSSLIFWRRNRVKVITSYFQHRNTCGALLMFLFNGSDFTRSTILALDQTTSFSYTIPFNLYPGRYKVFVYDIEQDGVLHSGVEYPAVTAEVTINGNEQSTAE